MTHTVLLWCEEPRPYVEAAERAGLAREVDFVLVPPREDPSDDVLARTDAILGWRAPAGLARRAPRLRFIQSLTAGVEQWLASPDLPAGVSLCCARGTHRIQMPENILAAIFAVRKQIPAIVRDQVERRWRRRINPPLAGTTLGILGVGAIGAEVARKADALEMRVMGTKRDPKPVPHVAEILGPDGTDAVLAASDFVLLLLPSTPATRGSIDAKALARMKPGAWLLNFARGDLVVDADVVDAVARGTIAGAVLDVYRTEPLPAEHPFWTTENILVLPHVGGLHPARDVLVAELFVDNLRRFVRGEPLREVVDPARGY
ncbi:MAG: D-2-hydroxyacid dehydrogenase [Candidatus Rokubacteria bacterium]|nr:D-2-hydroxyacid dehydrogenase [Candidatus Rokubacteria bacterium]